MKLKNILIVVNDIEKSKRFYRELFGLEVVTDLGGNVIMTEGLVLQERMIWEQAISRTTVFGNHDAELYFEETHMDVFLDKLKQTTFEIQYVHEPTKSENQTVVRIYDPDMHVIEVKG